jgi:hypothetical protein
LGRIWAILVPLALVGGVLRAEPTLEPAPSDERLDYVWRVEGIKGFFLRLVAPGRGEGTLTTVLNERGHYETELHITAQSRRRGDFYLYGSSIDPATRRSVRAWTAQQIGDKSKSREADLESEDVIDLASGILLVRREPPREQRRMRIWSNGNMYPVVLEPLDTRRAPFRGRLAEVRGYAIRGDRVPGEREWKGGLELYLADDPSATPVEMFVINKGVRVRLLLDQESSQFGLPETRRAAAGF